MDKVPEYIKFRSESIRMIAFALSILFGHFMLGLILEKYEIKSLVLKFQFLFSIFLICITNSLIIYSIRCIKNKEERYDRI